MNQNEFEALPLTEQIMLGEVLVIDDSDEEWWIGFIDGKPHRRKRGFSFSSAEFVVRFGERAERVRIPFQGGYTERVLEAAKEWGAKNFNCAVDEIDSAQLVST